MFFFLLFAVKKQLDGVRFAQAPASLGRVDSNLFKEFISIQILSVLQTLGTSRSKARAIGLCLVGHHPIHSRGSYANGPGLNVPDRIGYPHSLRLAP